jgi:DNA replication protein DnaC
VYTPTDLPIRRRTWLQIAGIPNQYLGWTLDDCQDASKTGLNRIRGWIEDVVKGDIIRASGKASSGKGLLISGHPGHGKTTIAAAAIQDMIRTFSMENFASKSGSVLVRPVHFITFAELLDLKGRTMESDPNSEDNLLLAGIFGEAKDDGYNIRILVIDDLGKEHTSASGWQKNMFHHVLRTRHSKGLPTIVTTNYGLSAWPSEYGESTASFAKEAFAEIRWDSQKGDLRKL